MRRLSPYLTRALLRTPLTANGVTWLMLPVGFAAAFLLSLPGVGPAVGAVALIKIQVLLDCSDGEVARWRQQFVEAVLHAPRTRPDRFTVLEQLALDERGVSERVRAFLDAFDR